MHLLEDLNKCANADELDEFISDNYLLLTDYLRFSIQSELREANQLFNSLILKVQMFESLDYSKNYNKGLINAILSVSIRLRYRFAYREFYRIHRKKNLTISKLLKASSIFMLDGQNIDAFINKFDDLHLTLEHAFLEEEDGYRNVISVLVNYYLFLITNFNEFAHEDVIAVRRKLLDAKQSGRYQFNQDDVIDSILAVDDDDTQVILLEIERITDEYLNRRSFKISSRYEYAIESNTEYSIKLGQPPYNIEKVIQISKLMYAPIASNKIFNSLQRGVKVITDSSGLLCYVHSYGKMHKSKLIEAISHLNIENTIFRVIDWGCGQGIGSLCLFEYLKNKEIDIDQYCRRLILIDPSDIALRRAALHVNGFCNEVVTYCKDIDSVTKEDLIDIKMSTIHIFSNILDIEELSMTDLIEKIKNSCKGRNYILIVSPKINDYKTERIDSFVNEFKRLPSFTMRYSSQASSGEWINSWTKIIRVFEITL